MEEELLGEKKAIEEELNAIPKRIKERRARPLNIIGMVLFALSNLLLFVCACFVLFLQYESHSLYAREFYSMVFVLVLLFAYPLSVVASAFLLAHKPVIGFIDSFSGGVIFITLFIIAVATDDNSMCVIISLVVIVVYVLLFACVPTILFGLTYPPMRGDYANVKELQKEQEQLCSRYRDVMIRFESIGSIYAEDMREMERRYRISMGKQGKKKEK